MNGKPAIPGRLPGIAGDYCFWRLAQPSPESAGAASLLDSGGGAGGSVVVGAGAGGSVVVGAGAGGWVVGAGAGGWVVGAGAGGWVGCGVS